MIFSSMCALFSALLCPQLVLQDGGHVGHIGDFGEGRMSLYVGYHNLLSLWVLVGR